MDNNIPRAKISDIARKAGVSSGTVDRVIHNRGEVAVRTREKILSIIREMDYQPDILASTLASKKTWRIAALIPQADIANPFWKSPSEGLQQAWQEVKHYGIEFFLHFFTYHDRNSFGKMLEKIIESNPAGIILAPVFTEQTLQYMPLLETLKIPVVFLNAQVENTPNLSYIGQDPIHSGMVAAHLLDFGLQDEARIFIINIISEKGGNSHILNREKGFREYFSERVNHKSLTTINASINNRKELFSLLDKAIPLSSDRTGSLGIFVTNSKVFHVATFLEENNRYDVRLVGYDLLEQNQEYLKKGIIDFLISQQPREQGYRSMITLFNHLVMKKPIIKNQFLPIDIITRENINFYINQEEDEESGI